MGDVLQIDDPAPPVSSGDVPKEEKKAVETKTDEVKEEKVDNVGGDESTNSVQKSPRQEMLSVKNESDIFSLKEKEDTHEPTMIFSINGHPSRKVFRKQEPAGQFSSNVEAKTNRSATPTGKRITRENYNDEKRPSSSYRNPLTGAGLSSTDEYKKRGDERTPLLGDNQTAPKGRVPPGGYSHKLW